jgi:hypothetical protein
MSTSEVDAVALFRPRLIGLPIPLTGTCAVRTLSTRTPMTRARRTSLLTAILLAATIPLAVPAARADVSAAARAFSDGQSAQLEGDFDHAAQSFELAFANAPSKEALRSAIRARQLAGQIARAATLAELALVKYADDTTSTKLANDVIAEARPKLGRVTIVCSPRCALAVGGRAMSLPAAETQVVYIAAGRQTVEATFDDGRTASRDVASVAGADNEVHLAPTAAPAPPPTPPQTTSPGPETAVKRERTEPGASHALSPVFALAGAAVTAGLAGVGIWSGLDTNKAHDAYVKNPTHAAYTAGQSKQLRTNILFGSAAVVGAATAVVAIWWTRWGSSETPPVALAPSSNGALVTYWGSF